MNLFEIPVYALSPEQLETYVAKRTQTITDECACKQCPDQIIRQAIYRETFPQRSWAYNHIVGYIRISIEHNDVIFRAYESVKDVTHYRWTTDRKWLLRDSLATGYHFRLATDMTTEKIRERIHDYLDDISWRYTAKGLYVDREAFDMADKVMDYAGLKEMEMEMD